MAHQVDKSSVDSVPSAMPIAGGCRASPLAPGWDELLSEFRALGGTADNVTLRQGSRGRGVFPVDGTKPVRLFVPPNLFVPSSDTEIRDGQLVVKASAAFGERERVFFDRYQRELSWGAGTFDDLWQMQLAWSRLPQELQHQLREIGGAAGDRFSTPSEEECRKRYLATRQLSYRGVSVLFPMAELVNHSDKVVGFEINEGVAVTGTFVDEVLVNYSHDDCWGKALAYGFCDAHINAFSLALDVNTEDFTVKISREIRKTEIFNGYPLPVVRTEGKSIQFSWLLLGAPRRPRVPRATFLHLAKKTPIKRPDELFDIIQHTNRIRFLGLLRISEGSAMPLVAMLHNAAWQQLETLSSYWGTRSLAVNP
jgi:hypothetical protein